jgi:hypothetical protein
VLVYDLTQDGHESLAAGEIFVLKDACLRGNRSHVVELMGLGTPKMARGRSLCSRFKLYSGDVLASFCLGGTVDYTFFEVARSGAAVVDIYVCCKEMKKAGHKGKRPVW